MDQLEAETIADPKRLGVRNATPVQNGWLVTLRDGRSCFVPNTLGNPAYPEAMSKSDPKPEYVVSPTESAPPPATIEPAAAVEAPPALKSGAGPAPPVKIPPNMYSLPPWDESLAPSPGFFERVRALTKISKCDVALPLCTCEVIHGAATNLVEAVPYSPIVIDHLVVSRGFIVDDFVIGNCRPLFASTGEGIPSDVFDYLTLDRQIEEPRPDLAGYVPAADMRNMMPRWNEQISQNVVYPGIRVTATIRNPSPVAKRFSALVIGRLIEA